MKEILKKLRQLFTEELLLYPFLTGILFIITELYINWTLSTNISKLFFVFIILSFCFLVNYSIHFLIKNRTKASLISTVFIVLNLYYLSFYNLINKFSVTKLSLELGTPKYPELYYILIFCFASLSLSILIYFTKRKLLDLNLYLNTVIGLFLIVKIGTILLKSPYRVELIPSLNQPNGKLVNSILINKPNIYFILLDSYTSSASLKKYWGFDNSPFENSLAKMGFYSTHNSKSNYDYTPYSIASYLNLSLLKLNPALPKNELYLQPRYNTAVLIKKSKVVQQIINSGYHFVNYSIFYINNNKSVFANLDDPESINTLFQPTIWYTIFSKNQLYNFESSQNSTTYPNLKIFQQLIDSIPNNRTLPTFVYAHIMMPHDPYEYDENGNRMSQEYKNIIDKGSYLKQLRYTNTVVIKTIQNILTAEKKKPIIIIQADHGFRHLKNVDIKEQRAEAHSIFSSYLYPENLSVSLNDSIQPITAISLLFSDP